MKVSTQMEVSLDGRDMDENETDIDLGVLIEFHEINEDVEDASSESDLRDTSTQE